VINFIFVKNFFYLVALYRHHATEPEVVSVPYIVIQSKFVVVLTELSGAIAVKWLYSHVYLIGFTILKYDVYLRKTRVHLNTS
jgi:hypothetical protein